MAAHGIDAGGNMKNPSESGGRHSTLAGVAVRFVTMAVFLTFTMALLFITAGRTNWI
jgi:hypothetical protein